MGEAAVRLTKEELDAYIDDRVDATIDKSDAKLADTIDGIRKDLIGEVKAEKAASARDKALQDFTAMAGPSQHRVMKRFRRNLFDSRQRKLNAGVNAAKGMPFINDGFDAKMTVGTGEIFTCLAPLIIRAKGRWGDAMKIARREGNNGLADYLEKTLAADDFNAGGALVPELMSADFIAYLYGQSVVRASGARTLDMSDGRPVRLGRQNSTTTAYWVGENEKVTKSEGGFGDLRLDLKTVGVLVPISEDLINAAIGDFVELVRDDMTIIAALKEDLAMLRSDGSENQPKGILNWTAAGNKFNSAGTSHANKHQDLIKAVYLLEAADVPTPDPVWYANPRATSGLALTLSSDGNPLWQIEMAMSGTINGYKVFKTTQIPVNLGAGTNESELYFVEPSQLVIGEGMKVEIAESQHASYTDGATTRSTFERFERLIRLGHKMDFVQRHDQAASIIQAVTYGDALD